MKPTALTGLILVAGLTSAVAMNAPKISLVDSNTPTEALLSKPGTYLGEAFTFEERHTGEVVVKVGVWEAGAGKFEIQDFPFTEYVLMISGQVVVSELDGVSRSFGAGDTFVIPKGWSGEWDVKQRMKKQIVRIGSADLLNSDIGKLSQ